MNENPVNPVKEKADAIHAAGLAAVEKGEVTGFRWPENLRQRWNCSMRFNDSVLTLSNRVLEPMKLAAQESFVTLLAAGRHYLVHCTLGEAVAVDGSEAPDKFSFLRAYQLISMELTFTELVVDKGNLLLAASEIPTEVLEVREHLERFYARCLLKAMPIKDLLHISLGRIMSGQTDGIRSFAAKMVELRRELYHQDPIRLTVCNIHTGSAAKLLE